jgi:hypothetical protein
MKRDLALGRYAMKRDRGERIDLVVGVPSTFTQGLLLLVERCQGDD